MRLIPTILAGWLLVSHNGGIVGWFDNRQDCQTVQKFASEEEGLGTYCIPDRFSLDEIRPPQEKTQ